MRRFCHIALVWLIATLPARAGINGPLGPILVGLAYALEILVYAFIYLGLPLGLVILVYKVWSSRDELFHLNSGSLAGRHVVRPRDIKPEWRKGAFTKEMVQVFTSLRKDFMDGNEERLRLASEGPALESFERGLKARGGSAWQKHETYTVEVKKITLLEATRSGEHIRMQVDFTATQRHNFEESTALHERWWLRSNDQGGWVVFERHNLPVN